MRGFRKIRIRCITDPARVDDLKGYGPGFTDSGKAIARDPGLVMDNGDTASHQPVEKG
jgi:hypothetical protein